MDEKPGKQVECVRLKFIVGFIAGVLFFLGALAVGYQFSRQTVDVFIPLTPVRIPDGLTPPNIMPKGIEVRLQGSRFAASKLSGADLSYDLDFSDVSEGVTTLPLYAENLRTPAGLSILTMQPDRATVRLEKQIEKRIPVVISFSGRPASGFEIEGFSVKPPMVTLSGAQSLLATMQSVSSKPVGIDGRSESFRLEIALDLAEGLERADGQAPLAAEIGIAEQVLVKTFVGLRVIGKEAKYRYSITPDCVDIAVRGPVRLVSALAPEKDVSAALILKDLKPGLYVRRATIALPVGVSLADAKPELFTVRVMNEKLQENRP